MAVIQFSTIKDTASKLGYTPLFSSDLRITKAKLLEYKNISSNTIFKSKFSWLEKEVGMRDFIQSRGETFLQPYQGSAEKLVVQCKNGHTYESAWGNVQNGFGCPTCSGKKKHEPEDIRKAFLKRGYIPTFKDEDYVNARSKLSYQCPEHGDQTIMYSNLYSGAGCPKCGKINAGNTRSVGSGNRERLLTLLKERNFEPLEDIKPTVRSFDMIKVRCLEDDYEWEISLNRLQIYTHGCPRCAGLEKSNFEELKREIESEKYTVLSPKQDINNTALIEVKCSVGHRYKTNNNRWHNGYRCLQCSPTAPPADEVVNARLDKIGFYKKELYKSRNGNLKIYCKKCHTSRDSYWGEIRVSKGWCYNCNGHHATLSDSRVTDYLKEHNYTKDRPYTHSADPLILTCPEGHKWKTRWDVFQRGYRCLECNRREKSRGETELLDLIRSWLPDYEVISGDRKLIAPKEIDILIPEKKIAIEYCGVYWHSTAVRPESSYHLNKLKACQAKGYRLIQIWDTVEWTENNLAVVSRLKRLLRVTTKRLEFEDTSISPIDRGDQQLKRFLYLYSLEEIPTFDEALGVYLGDDLVSVASLLEEGSDIVVKIDTKVGYNLSSNIISRIFKEVSARSRARVVTYSDRRWSEGSGYKKLGFKLDVELEPDYFIIQANAKVYDCGRFRWVYQK